MKKVAVILSGCGVYDGSEIYESVLTLLAIEEGGARYQCLAPDIDQLHVINHRTGEVMPEQNRNVLLESARLARGEVIDLAGADPADYDALIIPGGFGAAKNLCDFAVSGADCEVNEDLVRFTQAMNQAGKPVGLMCIAPAMTPILFGEQVSFTIGNDADTASTIEAMGGTHRNCGVDEIITDTEMKVVTTPAYMLAGSISEAASGIRKLVAQVLEMA